MIINFRVKFNNQTKHPMQNIDSSITTLFSWGNFPQTKLCLDSRDKKIIKLVKIIFNAITEFFRLCAISISTLFFKKTIPISALEKSEPEILPPPATTPIEPTSTLIATSPSLKPEHKAQVLSQEPSGAPFDEDSPEHHFLFMVREQLLDSRYEPESFYQSLNDLVLEIQTPESRNTAISIALAEASVPSENNPELLNVEENLSPPIIGSGKDPISRAKELYLAGIASAIDHVKNKTELAEFLRELEKLNTHTPPAQARIPERVLLKNRINPANEQPPRSTCNLFQRFRDFFF